MSLSLLGRTETLCASKTNLFQRFVHQTQYEIRLEWANRPASQFVVFGRIIRRPMKKVKREPRAILGGAVPGRAMWRSVTEEDDAASLQFDGNRFRFIRVTTNVMVRHRIAAVLEYLIEYAGNHVHRAILAGGVVNGNPHRGALHGVGDFEIGVVLMPVGSHAVTTRLEKDLIEMQHDGITNQRGDRLDDLGFKRKGSDKRRMPERGTKLQVSFGGRARLSVPLRGDIPEQAFLFQPGDIVLQRQCFPVVEESRDGHITLFSKLPKLGI
jgi:hypothetical protein